MTCIEHEKENIPFGIVPWCSLLVIQKLWSLTMFQTILHVNLCVSPLSFHMETLLYQHGQYALDTSRTLFLLASTQGASCRLVMNHLIYVYVLSHHPHPREIFFSFFFTFHHYIYVSMCVYVYVHISLFLPECACTTIIDTSPWIFSLMYCCVSITFVNCICPPGALIWLINLFLFLFLFYTFI